MVNVSVEMLPGVMKLRMTSVGLKVYPSFSARYGVRELVRPAVVWLTGPGSCNPLFSIVSFSPCFLLKLLRSASRVLSALSVTT
jgi:hypothetical protein